MNGEYNFTVFPSQTVMKTIVWYDVNKHLVDLTLYHARLTIYNPNTLVTILSLIDTGVSPGLVMGGTAGTIAITITDAQTTLFTFDFARYFLRVQLTGASGFYRDLLTGIITNRRL